MPSTTSGRVRMQVLVAAFERRAAEIGGREIALLQHGPHGPVEHEDTLLQNVCERALALFGVWS